MTDVAVTDIDMTMDTIVPDETTADNNCNNNDATMLDWTPEQHFNLANIYLINEQYDSAVDSYARAEVLLKEQDQQKSSVLLLLFRICSIRSVAFRSLERYEDAYDDAKAAIDVVQKSFASLQGSIHRNEIEIGWKRYGLAALDVKEYNDAIHGFKQALQLAQLNQNTKNITSYQTYIQKCETALAPPAPVSTSSATNDDDNDQMIIEDITESSRDVKPKATTTSAATTKSQSTLSESSSTVSISSNLPYVVPKYQYYQNDKYMTIQILAADLTAERLNVNIGTEQITVTVRNGSNDYTIICGVLYDAIDPLQSKTVYKSEKTLIKLKKVKTFEWHELLKKESVIGKKKSSVVATKSTPTPASTEDVATMDTTATNSADVPAASSAAATAPSNKKATAIPRPYASHKDWDTIEKVIEQEEEEIKPTGDDAMNKLFEQIYKNADEDTRRAMIKSYQTSGGTVLSTNWKEVATKDYENERTAPKGMEWKTWEGQKLPMKDDD